jgi:Cu/Ag efflux protein CusF
MKKIWTGTMAMALAVLLAVPVFAAEEKKATDMPSGARMESSTITATVEKIDYKARTVVLKGTKGVLMELEVGEEARNFDQVKKGDIVTIENTEAVAIEVQKSKGKPIAVETTSMTRSKPGEKPAGTMKTEGIMTVTVEKIDHKTREATLKLADGEIMEIRVGPQVKRLNEIHKGDQVLVRYMSSVSISVKKP